MRYKVIVKKEGVSLCSLQSGAENLPFESCFDIVEMTLIEMLTDPREEVRKQGEAIYKRERTHGLKGSSTVRNTIWDTCFKV